MAQDEDLLIAVLNSAPVLAGTPQEQLTGKAGMQLARNFGGTGSPEELATLIKVRDSLQQAIRGNDQALADLSQLTSDIVMTPNVTAAGIHWELSAPATSLLAARTLVAWSEVQHERPGRLRACANTECNLFLVDRSRPGTAKWCSMATCGNRIKVRAHAKRNRSSAESESRA